VVSRAVSPEGKTVLVPVLEGLFAGALWQNGPVALLSLDPGPVVCARRNEPVQSQD
jgi:hypothetical protein